MHRKITPGKVEYATGPALRGKYHVVESSDGVCLAECYEGSEVEQEANAQLYALAHNTANELYDAGYDAEEVFKALPELVEVSRRIAKDAGLTGLDKEAGWDCWFDDINKILSRLTANGEG